jgi:sugar-specific transcriptional regulator TrmB
MANNLGSIGFTSGEEKVYVALLKIGSSSTGPIAREAGVSRSKLYEILEKLSKKGIVSHFKKNNVSYFQAAHPSRIMNYLQEKEEDIKNQKNDFEKKIPLFEQFLNQPKIKQEAEVFEGMEGIKNVREVALNNMKSGETMLYFGNPASGHEYVLGYWDDWNERRIKKKITAKIAYNPDAKEYGERRKKQKYTEVRYLPKKGNTPAWIEIYGNTVAIVMKYKTPMSIVINNELVAESFRTYFEILWNISSKI